MSKIFIFFHGYGDSGKNIENSYLYDYFAENLLNVKIFSPNAPYPLLKEKKPSYKWLEEYEGGGYYWFPIDIFDEKHILNGIKNVLPIMKKYIRTIMEQEKCEKKDIILSGFSQGTAIATFLALESEENYAGVISFSGGGLISPSYFFNGDIEIKSKTPFCFIHGNRDKILPYELSKIASEELQKVGIKTELKIIKNLEHNISEECLEFALDFIKNLKN